MNIQMLTDERPILHAASELQGYLSRMGAEEILPPSWTLGVRDLTPYGLQPPRDPKLDDSYAFCVDGQQAYVYGSNSRSVLLGVYHYLRMIGCRFLRPGGAYEVVPVKEKAEDFFAQCAHSASMRHRGVCIEGADSIENVLDFIDWLPKLGFNSFFLQFKYPHTFLQKWYEHINNPQIAPQKWTMAQTVAADAVMNEAIEMRGLLQHRVGHGWTGEALGYTATGWDKDHSEMSPETTELLAEIKGERKLFGGVPTNTNLCYSNEKAVKLYADCVIAYAKEHPEADFLHLWLADLFNNVCECENCSKKIVTDHYIHMLNVIDEMLTAQGLDTKLVFLLYQELRWPPQTEQLNHPDRFMLMFAPISRTFLKSYSHAGELPPIPPYELNHIQMPTTMEANLSYLKAWQERVNCDSFIYDYHLGKAHYGDPGYVHISKIICEDIKANKSLGMDGINSCQELRAAFPNALPNYVMGLASLDVELTFEQVAEEYYRSAYGARWQEALGYLTRVSELYNADYVMGMGKPQNPDMAKRFEAVLRLADEFAPTIEAALADGLSPVERRFWEELAYHRDYLTTFTHALLKRAKGEDPTADYHAFADLVRRMEPRFQQSLDVYRVLQVTRNFTGLHE